MIYYIIGIRRSGLHAIANWFFPMMGEYIYLNNYELGKLTDIEIVVFGKFNVLIGIESKDIDEVLKYCNNGKRIFVLRHPSSIIGSQEKWYSERLSEEQTHHKLSQAITQISQYSEYLSKSDELTIMYELWNEDINYRKKKAKELGLSFDDSNKTKVFGYGVSSFDNTKIEIR